MVDERKDPRLRIELVHPTRRLDVAALESLLWRVASEEGRDVADLSVILTGHDEVLSLNRSYLQHDYVTDVLSFDLSDRPEVIEGEVYVDLDTAAERHEEFGSTYEEEAFRYAVHGVLHLAGHSDETPGAREQMHVLEDRYLALWRHRA